MQRQTASLLLALALLYLGACALANRGVQAQADKEPAAVQNDQQPAQANQQPDPAVPGSGPHIAVLLPLKSSAVGRQADAVRLGILEAARIHRGTTLPLIVHATGDDVFDATSAYENVVRAGAQLVIGPLTRSAVTGLAGTRLVTVPTLALNAPEVDALLPPDFYVFGLQIENEAKQIAQIARERGLRKAIIILSESGLSHRLAQAFADELARRGGNVVEQFQYTTDTPSLMRLREDIGNGVADMVFLALDAKRARLIRSYLGGSVTVYATSIVYTSAEPLANYELNGVYFVDMPWLLSPDHPAVLVYNRQDQATIEFQRFYALGIDAYRVAQELLKPNISPPPLDGVTGQVTLAPNHQFLRESVLAQFNQGEARALSPASGSLER